MHTAKKKPELALALEREFLATQITQLLLQGHRGSWACVTGQSIIGLFDTARAAYAAGIAEFGDATPFLVAQIDDSPR
jgi:hypothetical protein